MKTVGAFQKLLLVGFFFNLAQPCQGLTENVCSKNKRTFPVWREMPSRSGVRGQRSDNADRKVENKPGRILILHISKSQALLEKSKAL